MKKVLFIVFLTLFVATAIITLLGLIGQVTISEGYLKSLFTLLIVEMIATVILWAKKPEILAEGPDPSVISGHWWELIYNHPTVAISHVYIQHVPGGLQLDAQSYGFNRSENARWESEIACLKADGAKLHLWYIWKGKEQSIDPSQIDSNPAFAAFSGIGCLTFSTAKGSPREGTAWFTRGDIIHQPNMSYKQDAFMRRLTPDEEKQIPAGSNHPNIEDALAAYDSWAERKNLRRIKTSDGSSPLAPTQSPRIDQSLPLAKD